MFYVGFLRKYSVEDERWNPLCTIFFVAQNVAASAGVCINQVDELDGFDGRYDVQTFSNTAETNGIDIHTILGKYSHHDFIHENNIETPILDIGLLLVSLRGVSTFLGKKKLFFFFALSDRYTFQEFSQRYLSRNL